MQKKYYRLIWGRGDQRRIIEDDRPRADPAQPVTRNQTRIPKIDPVRGLARRVFGRFK